jgi:excisionase family DNA binding protein
MDVLAYACSLRCPPGSRIPRRKRDMEMATTDVVLTVPETAARLRISKSAVYELIARHELEVVAVYGRTRRVLASSVDDYVERRRRID